MLRSAAIALVLSFGMSACGDSEEDAPRERQEPAASTGAGGSGGSGTGGGGGTAFVPDVSFQPCALDSAKASGDDAECATVSVPADWSDPAGPQISLFVKRYPIADQPEHLWLVSGGPGFSSVEWEARVEQMALSLPDAQFYMLDHRGTGRSSRLGCVDAEAVSSEGGYDITLDEWPACIAELQTTWGERLPFFSTSQAARDLGELAEALRGGSDVAILGQSYGTYMLQRYLSFYPTQAKVVLLDSLSNPGATFTRFSEHVDEVGHLYLDLCGADAACASRLGPNPRQTAEDAFATAFEGGGCTSETLTRDALARALYGLLTFAQYRALIAPIVVRLARCAPEDKAALEAMLDLFSPVGGKPDLVDAMFSSALHKHVILSEMWEAPAPGAEEHLASLQDIEFGLLDVELDVLRPIWPVYEREPRADQYPTTSLPLLMLNGTLDAQTPLLYAKEAEPHYLGEHQHFIVVPGAPHGAIGGEPWSQASPPCSVRIATAFYDDPATAPDTSCFAEADPVSFEPTSMVSQLFFETTDPWGDTLSTAAPSATNDADRAAARRELAQIRTGYAR